MKRTLCTAVLGASASSCSVDLEINPAGRVSSSRAFGGWKRSRGKAVETERDTKFVELGRYLCEVRAGRYWGLEEMNSFDEFLERRFPVRSTKFLR